MVGRHECTPASRRARAAPQVAVDGPGEGAVEGDAEELRAQGRERSAGAAVGISRTARAAPARRQPPRVAATDLQELQHDARYRQSLGGVKHPALGQREQSGEEAFRGRGRRRARRFQASHGRPAPLAPPGGASTHRHLRTFLHALVVGVDLVAAIALRGAARGGGGAAARAVRGVRRGRCGRAARAPPAPPRAVSTCRLLSVPHQAPLTPPAAR